MKIGEPQIVERMAQPYVAIRRLVTIPFGDVVPEAMEQLFGQLKKLGLSPGGPVFFKYNFIAMPKLEIDFAVPVAQAGTGGSGLIDGVLPAGRYAELRFFGHYDNLIDANAALLNWGRGEGLVWDRKETPEGDYFRARTETYLTSPDTGLRQMGNHRLN
jgi:effector-binding domain-containing protein